MIGDWTAAAVRARAMGAARVGAGAADEAGRQQGLPAAIGALSGSIHAERLIRTEDLESAQRAVRAGVLWELRVMAGWMPPTGTTLARALAAVFERDDLAALADAIARDAPPPARHELGVLSSAGAPAWSARSWGALREALRHGAWGDPGPDPAQAHDVLTASMLRRLASVAPVTAPWAAGALALMAARILVVERRDPPERLIAVGRTLIGDRWPAAGDLAALRRSLPRTAAETLAGTDGPDDLWRAEMRWRAHVEGRGFRLLRDGRLGPETALGAFTVLWIDGLRVCEALACAEAGGGGLLDAVA